MAGAVILKSKNTLVAGRSPIALGDALHLEASRAVAVDDKVNLTDYLNSARVFTQLSGVNTKLPSAPVIQTVDGFEELDFPKGAGLASAYDALNGAAEATIYLVLRANLSSANANGVIFRWMATYTGTSATDKGFILRRSASTNSLQFLLDSGSVTASVIEALSGTGYKVIAVGWSVANNTLFLNINGTEATATLGSVVGPTGGGLMSFGYSPDYATQRCPMGLRTALGYAAYHDAETRALMVQKLMEDNGLS